MEKSDNVIIIKSNLCLSAKGLEALRNSFFTATKGRGGCGALLL